eukprot:1220541-Rhodomonas_salina.2
MKRTPCTAPVPEHRVYHVHRDTETERQRPGLCHCHWQPECETQLERERGAWREGAWHVRCAS